jgi:hypothetical protein
LLLETKDLLNATMNLLEEYHSAHDSSVRPATLTIVEEEIIDTKNEDDSKNGSDTEE